MAKRSLTELLSEMSRRKSFNLVAGAVSGVLIILGAVAISALVFRIYGWGLFVLTPFVVGVTTGYLVNRRELLSGAETSGLVLASAALGCGALILFALEGLICLILAAPLAAGLAIAGGAIGRALAKRNIDPAAPFYSVALLPLMFAIDAASPPEALMLTEESIVVSAPPPRIWQELVSDTAIGEPPTVVGRLGLAYPHRATLSGAGPGAGRTGYFSTGVARERVNVWQPGRTLGFIVLTQPPAMEEMSPYQRVHAPHLVGYFETGETRFDLQPVGGGRTRLSITAAHRLRLDPLVYWKPIARWAIRSNAQRVLRDLKVRAEEGRVTAASGG